MSGKLYGVGVGPGDPELLTIKALRILENCDVIAIPGKPGEGNVAYHIALKACPQIADKEKIYIDTPMSKDINTLEKGYRSAADTIAKFLDNELNVAMLSLGDPTIYSTYIYIHRIISECGYCTEIINGIPSFCAAAARYGDSIADRSTRIHIVPSSYDIKDALLLSGTKILMKAGSKMGEVKTILESLDVDAFMVENCGMDNERVYTRIQDFPEDASYYSLIFIRDNVRKS